MQFIPLIQKRTILFTNRSQTRSIPRNVHPPDQREVSLILLLIIAATIGIYY